MVVIIGEGFVFLLRSVIYREEYFWSILEALYILLVKWHIVYWYGVTQRGIS